MSNYSELSHYFTDYKIRFSLSSRAKELFETLGAQYFISVFEPLTIAHPDKILTVFLNSQNQEPVIPINDLQTNEIAYTKDGNCVGCVYLIPKDKTTIKGEITRVGLLPTVESYKQTQVFNFVQPGNIIKNTLAKVYVKLYEKAPLLLDAYKQYKSDRSLAATVFSPRIQKCDFTDGSQKFEKKTMWVAMHWLENGGAESWAIEQLKLASEAGYDVYVTTDRQAPQRLCSLVSKYAKVLLCSSILSQDDWKDFALNFIEKYEISNIHIHHSALAYGLLLRIKTLFPDMYVADSTHIVEYRGGGFVFDSISYSNLIDLHHVISPQLLDVYLSAGIDSKKVYYKPLTGFTHDDNELTVLEEKELAHPIRIGFMSRYSIQKRPFVYLYLVKYLSTLYPGKFVYYMQGSGELENIIMRKAKKLGVDKKIVFSSWSPAKEFLNKIDVLLVPSENEGLTLTTLEADNNAVLVVSSNVGSQQTVIAKEALLNKQSIKFILSAKNLLLKLAKNKEYYLDLLKEQRELVNAVRSVESASAFFENQYENEKVKL